MKNSLRCILLGAFVLCAGTGLRAQTITLISGNGAIGTRDPVNLFSIDGGVTFTNAYINNQHPLYDLIPSTHWIGVQSNGYGPSNITNIYRVFFTLDAGYTDPWLSIQILADDAASVFLNGNLIGSQSSPPSNYTNPPSVFSTSNGAYFLTGQNVLTITCYNQNDLSSNPTGIDYSATVVPEPATVVQTVCGLAGLFFLCRRRKA